MARRITGAIGIAGRVYRAGQEAELEAAAARAGIDLTLPRFARSIEGSEPVAVPEPAAVEAEVVFTPAAPKPAAKKAAPKAPGKGSRSLRKGK